MLIIMALLITTAMLSNVLLQSTCFIELLPAAFPQLEKVVFPCVVNCRSDDVR